MGAGNISEDRMTKDFQNLVKDINLEIIKIQRPSNTICSRKK